MSFCLQVPCCNNLPRPTNGCFTQRIVTYRKYSYLVVVNLNDSQRGGKWSDCEPLCLNTGCSIDNPRLAESVFLVSISNKRFICRQV